MLLSIIIPFYNARPSDIIRCLDSIYSSHINPEDFEVIIINDCSTDSESLGFLKDYISQLSPQLRPLLINHQENKRQGGARNTGIRNAEGKFIQYIDQDDYFAENALNELINFIRINPNLDIIMMDYKIHNLSNSSFKGPFYFGNNKSVMKGKEFILKCQIPWEPWQYCYRKDFLIQKEIDFEENVRFEDVDYVMKATMEADKMIFVPTVKIIHTQSSFQTTMIGDDYVKIEDITKCQYRVRLVGESYLKTDPDCGKLIISHHQFAYNDFIKRYYWRLKPSLFLKLMKEYPARLPSNFKLLNAVVKNKKLFTYSCSLLRPVLKLARYSILKFRK